jgi:hypothetical protein
MISAAIDLNPAPAVKRSCENAKSSAGIAPQVVDFVCGLATADDDPALGIESRRDRRHLQAAVLSPGG